MIKLSQIFSVAAFEKKREEQRNKRLDAEAKNEVKRFRAIAARHAAGIRSDYVTYKARTFFPPEHGHQGEVHVGVPNKRRKQFTSAER